ncbi:hypothetical protein [Christiangramia aquimixticola]|uniref:hypothetical protein n=1 Tax=Christiangramia aquimixticola TaxID=1697558 RepID=UPI003AA94B42
MKKLLYNFFVFISILFLVIITCVLLTRYKSDFQLDQSYSSIVVGHSHSECSFNDELIAGFSNKSNSGQSYFYNYFKLKEILKDNPQLKTVFIEYSNLDIVEQRENWVWGEEKIVEYFPVYAFYMDSDSHEILYRNNPKDYKGSLTAILKRSLVTVANGMDLTDKTGGYQKLQKNLPQNFDPDEIFKPVDIPSIPVAEVNLEYLNKMILLCRRYGVEVVLVRSPLHKSYQGFKAEELYKKVRQERFGNVKYLDFSKFPIADEGFADPEHLNAQGAEKFSIWFDQLLQDGLLAQVNPQDLINEEMAKINGLLTN